MSTWLTATSTDITLSQPVTINTLRADTLTVTNNPTEDDNVVCTEAVSDWGNTYFRGDIDVAQQPEVNTLFFIHLTESMNTVPGQLSVSGDTISNNTGKTLILMITLNLEWNRSANTTYFTAHIFKSGTAVATDHMALIDSNTVYENVSTLIDMGPSDTIQVAAFFRLGSYTLAASTNAEVIVLSQLDA